MKTLDRFELTLWLAVPLTGLALVACGGERGAEPDEVREALDDVVVPIVDDTSAAFQFLDDSSVLANLDGSTRAMPWGDSAGDDMEAPEPDPEPEEIEPDPNEPTPGEELAQYLREVIFTQDNYEGDGIYRIRGRDVCAQEGMEPTPIDEDAPADPEAEGTEDCERMVDEMELRIEVMLVDGGFDATLLVGPRRAKPVRLESRDDRITVIANLAAAKAAIEHVASVTGAEVELPDVLEGVVAASLQRDGEAAATVVLSIREDVAVEATTEDGAVSFEAAARQPLARLSIDAIARHLELQANAGPVLASVPWGLFEEDTEIGGTLHVDLAGATGTLVLDDDDRAVTLTGVGLGESTSRITLDDQVLWAIDVNPEEGRTFDMTVTPGDGGATLAIEPGLHVVTTVDMRPITESWDEVDPAQDGDTYEIVFDGDHPAAETIDGDETHDGALRVTSGRLRLSATGATPIDVEAGECLVDSEVEEGEHPSLGGLASGACPE
jgi:hypothetical protein